MAERPAVDWAECLELAGDNEALARELLHMLGEEIQIRQASLAAAFLNRDYAQLLEHAHKLHGATAYCGVPALRVEVARLEAALKQGEYARLPTLLAAVEGELNRVQRALDATSLAGAGPEPG